MRLELVNYLKSIFNRVNLCLIEQTVKRVKRRGELIGKWLFVWNKRLTGLID